MSPSNTTQLFRQQAIFIAGSNNIHQLPKLSMPEIAFVGKSNVGKSSLINMLCNNKNLAKISNTPGRTQQINFFQVADNLILVDLPGYGFAEVPRSVKANWEELILYYLKNRLNLKLVNILIDARRGIKPHDEAIAKILRDYNREFQIVFTKSDKATNIKNLINEGQNFLATLSYSCNLIYTSSRSKQGVTELQHSFKKYITDTRTKNGRRPR